MYNLATTSADAGQNERAVKVLEDMLKVLSAKLEPDHPSILPIRLGIASIKVRLGRAAEAAADCRRAAEAFEKLNGTDAGSLYNAACFRAVLAGAERGSGKSAESAKQADLEADRAMTWLKKAVAAGYRDADHISKDHDLDALGDRADFKKLLSDLQSGTRVKQSDGPKKASINGAADESKTSKR